MQRPSHKRGPARGEIVRADAKKSHGPMASSTSTKSMLRGNSAFSGLHGNSTARCRERRADAVILQTRTDLLLGFVPSLRRRCWLFCFSLVGVLHAFKRVFDNRNSLIRWRSLGDKLGERVRAFLNLRPLSARDQ